MLEVNRIQFMALFLWIFLSPAAIGFESCQEHTCSQRKVKSPGSTRAEAGITTGAMVVILTAQAEELVRKGELTAAEEKFRSIIEQFPEDYEAWDKCTFGLAELYEKKGDYAGAINLWNEFRVKFENDQTTRAMFNRPRSIDCRLRAEGIIAHLYRRWGKHEQALKGFNEVIRLLKEHPLDGTEYTSYLINVIYSHKKAEVYREMGDLANALKQAQAIQQWVKNNPIPAKYNEQRKQSCRYFQDIELVQFLADTHFAMGNYTEALRLYEEIASIRPYIHREKYALVDTVDMRQTRYGILEDLLLKFQRDELPKLIQQCKDKITSSNMGH